VAALVLRTDAHAWSRGMAGLLVGRDPVEVGARWDELAAATYYDGNAGLSRHALAAVDIALHDLAGKQLGRPAHALLGGARREKLSVYATLYRAASGHVSATALHEELEALVGRARQDGYRAVKYEAIYPGAVSDAEVVSLVTRARAVAGDEMELLVDFGYRWRDWRDALWTLNRLEPARLWMAEATLPDGDLGSHAKLAARCETRIGGAELASTLAECRAWIEQGRVDVLQPDVARCGGLTEMRRVADLAALHGVTVVPHNWKTGINAAAARHLHAAASNVPMIEVLPPSLFDSPAAPGAGPARAGARRRVPPAPRSARTGSGARGGRRGPISLGGGRRMSAPVGCGGAPVHRLERLRQAMEVQGWDCVVASGAGHVAHLAGYARYYSGPAAVMWTGTAGARSSFRAARP
jgi:L-alanine-DL-glutamate epimerase-like enolase superfamily enzyme